MVSQDWAQTTQQHRCPPTRGQRGRPSWPRLTFHTGARSRRNPGWVGPNAHLQMITSLAQEEDGTGRRDCRREGPWRRAPSLGGVTQGGPAGRLPAPRGLYSRPGWVRVLPPESPGSSLLPRPRRSRRKGVQGEGARALTGCDGAHDACSCAWGEAAVWAARPGSGRAGAPEPRPWGPITLLRTSPGPGCPLGLSRPRSLMTGNQKGGTSPRGPACSKTRNWPTPRWTPRQTSKREGH